MQLLARENLVLGYSASGIVVFLVSLGPDGRVVLEPVARALPLISPVPAIA